MFSKHCFPRVNSTVSIDERSGLAGIVRIDVDRSDLTGIVHSDFVLYLCFFVDF